MQLASLFTIYLLILFGPRPISAQSQSEGVIGEVVYAYYPDSAAIFLQRETLKTEDATDNARSISHLQDQYYVTRSLRFQLLFNREASLFELSPQLRLDTDNRFLYNLAILETRGDRRHYLNTVTRTRLYERPDLSSDTIYHITEVYDKHPWIISEDTRTIAGYSCRKAHYDYTYTDLDDVDKTVHVIAWYAPDLPYSFGPAGFDGLPGMILEVSTQWKRKNTYRATSISLFVDDLRPLPELVVPDRIITEEILERESRSFDSKY